MTGKASSQSSKQGSQGDDEPEYEFPDVDFDEQEFREKEIDQAYMTFLTFGIAILTGILARLTESFLSPPADWKVGFLPIVAVAASLRPILRSLGYGERVQSLKDVAGNLFLLVFTAFAVWVLASNPPLVGYFP